MALIPTLMPKTSLQKPPPDCSGMLGVPGIASGARKGTSAMGLNFWLPFSAAPLCWASRPSSIHPRDSCFDMQAVAVNFGGSCPQASLRSKFGARQSIAKGSLEGADT